MAHENKAFSQIFRQIFLARSKKNKIYLEISNRTNEEIEKIQHTHMRERALMHTHRRAPYLIPCHNIAERVRIDANHANYSSDFTGTLSDGNLMLLNRIIMSERYEFHVHSRILLLGVLFF